MTIQDKLNDVVSGATPERIAIIGESQWYWTVEYWLGQTRCEAEVLKRQA